MPTSFEKKFRELLGYKNEHNKIKIVGWHEISYQDVHRILEDGLLEAPVRDSQDNFMIKKDEYFHLMKKHKPAAIPYIVDKEASLNKLIVYIEENQAQHDLGDYLEPRL